MQKSRLFLASCLSLVTCAALFAIRTNIATELGTHFAADPERIGKVLGQGFFGMGYVIAIASPLCDFLGMKRLLVLAFVLHVVGMVGFLFAPTTATDPELQWAQYAMLCVGLAHGLVEGVINPLIATLYPEEKTHKLNVLHAWWPGGIILGGLAAWFLRAQGFSWQVQWSVGFLPTVMYGVVALTAQFPKTERAASGVSAATMVAACLHPLFLVFFAMMALTAATELGTGQWLDAVLTKTAGFEGILLLVYGSGLMFVMRFFAGPLAHRLSPVGLLTVSAVLASIGLWMLSIATNPGLAIAAATVFFVGVCYFWPTMLGVVSERHPKTGALGMGLLAASGFLGSGYLTERMGTIYKEQGAAAAFGFAAWLPVVLTVVFVLVWLWIRARGGYRVEKLGVPSGE
jgi:hypothetical protein